jgi:hypothetical protein
MFAEADKANERASLIVMDLLSLNKPSRRNLGVNKNPDNLQSDK